MVGRRRNRSEEWRERMMLYLIEPDAPFFSSVSGTTAMVVPLHRNKNFLEIVIIRSIHPLRGLIEQRILCSVTIIVCPPSFSSSCCFSSSLFFRYDGDECGAAQEEGRSQWHHPPLGPSLTFMVVMHGWSV